MKFRNGELTGRTKYLIFWLIISPRLVEPKYQVIELFYQDSLAAFAIIGKD